MNPLTWRHQHQLALLLGVVLGVILGLLVGFMYEGIHYGTLDQWHTASRFRWESSVRLLVFLPSIFSGYCARVNPHGAAP